MTDNKRMALLALGVVVLMLAGFMLYTAVSEPVQQVQQKQPTKVIKTIAPSNDGATGLVTTTIIKSQEVRQ